MTYNICHIINNILYMCVCVCVCVSYHMLYVICCISHIICYILYKTIYNICNNT